MRDGPELALNRAFLSLGSNIEPRKHLVATVNALRPFGQLIGVSSVWESPPADGTDQPNYLNAAVLLATSLSADRICHETIPHVERLLDRVRDPANKFAPRTIDIDLVLFNSEILVVDHRKIPDPSIQNHAFVAVPLAELEPGYCHPESSEPLSEIAARLNASGCQLTLCRDITDRLVQIIDGSKLGK